MLGARVNMTCDGDFLKENMNFNVWMGAQMEKKYEKEEKTLK